MPLCEHVYRVAVTFKMTEWIEQWIYIKFCVKLEHFSMESIWMIKTTAMGNWWLAVSTQQCTCSCTMSCAEFFGKTSNNPGSSAPPQPRFETMWLLAFPKTKIIFEKKEISDHWWDSGKYDVAADGGGRTVWGPKVPTLKGTEVSLPMYNVSCIFFSKCLYFSCYMAGSLQDRPQISWIFLCYTCLLVRKAQTSLLPILQS